MSAAPRPSEPEPTPASGSDADGWALLEALRRRLDDQASQGRKTQQQVSQLAESIGALVAQQRARSRWLNMNSFVAYLVFTVLVGTAFLMLYRSRATELVDARDSAMRERDRAVRRADEATAKATAREQADTRAWEVYQLLEAGKRSEAAGKLATLTELPLSRTERAVLAARAHETQVMEVDAALKAAAHAFKAGRHIEVIKPLEAALISEPAGARAAAMRYFLGVAYAKNNELLKAITHLQQAIAADTDHEDARFQLASALDRSGQYPRARAEYDRFATAHPQSQLAAFAMRRSATLARMPATPAPKASPPAETSPITEGTKPAAPPPTIVPSIVTKPAGTAATPVKPAPIKAAPAKPAPMQPTPAKPAPAKPAVTKPLLAPTAEPAPTPAPEQP